MKCPICHHEVDEREKDRKGSVYPFCSQRCKLIDLGRWLGGKYQIPAEPEGDEHESIPHPREREE